MDWLLSHIRSSRSDKSFIAIDCSSLVESLFESELFSHKGNTAESLRIDLKILRKKTKAYGIE